MGKRMYSILKVILMHDIISAKDIVEILKKEGISMSLNTVYSVIKEINAFFFDIIHGEFIEAVRNKGFKVREGLFLDGELQFLCDSLSFHEDLSEEDAYQMKEKLLTFSSLKQREHLIDSDYPHQESFSLITNLNVIMRAIQEHKVIAFKYITYEVEDHHFKEVPSHHNRQYYISPYHIIMNHNHYYLIGYDDRRVGRLSSYRIDRMRMIQVKRNVYKDITDQFDMEKEISKMINMFTSKENVCLKLMVEPGIIREVVSRFGYDIYVDKQYDQRYMVMIKDVPLSLGLKGWLFMLQTQIEVLEPLSLRESMMDTIEQLQHMYQRGEDND